MTSADRDADACLPRWAIIVALSASVAFAVAWPWFPSASGIVRGLVAWERWFFFLWVMAGVLALIADRIRLKRAELQTGIQCDAAPSTVVDVLLSSPWICAATLASIGFLVSAGAGWRWMDLPLLYQDEYAYLFGAQTILLGKLTLPAEPLATFFQQMHVLSAPAITSKYFIGTSAWIAPWLAAGIPMFAMWLASGLTAGFTALLGWRFSPRVGWIAGMIAAASSCLALFGNHLLSAQPSTLFLVAGTCFYFRMLERPQAKWGLLCGLAFGAALLTRPASAVGMGFPLALYAFRPALRRATINLKTKLVGACLAIAIGIAAQLAINVTVAGHPMTTPHGLFTRLHTPSHGYGFYNHTRGVPARGPQTILPYDDWAWDLTPSSAATITLGRLGALMERSVGLFAGAFALVLIVLIAKRLTDRELLLGLSLLGLFAIHVPFWYEGIMGVGYVAEGMPLVAILVAVVIDKVTTSCRTRNRIWQGRWWLLLPAASAAYSLFVAIPFSFSADVDSIAQRRQLDMLRDLERQWSAKVPVLVIVDADPAEAMHLSLVFNDPLRQGSVLRAWDRGEHNRVLMDAFPDRAIYQLKFAGFRNILTRMVRPPLTDARQN